MGPELVVAKEAANLLKRDFNKYKRGVAGMYLLSAYGLEVGSTCRSAYYFVRHIDDVLDGDRQISSDPLDYVQDLRFQVETGNYTPDLGIVTLAKYAISHLERKKGQLDNPRLEFLRSIDGIIFDHERSKDRRTLTAEQLEDYYLRAFDPVVNLTLMILNSSLRSKDVPAMSYGQGRVYSVKDLEADWIRGTINISEEVLRKALLTTYSSVEEVKTSAEIQKWFNQVFIETKPELVQLDAQIRNMHEGATSFILGGLINPMLKFIDEYERKFRLEQILIKVHFR